MAVLIGTRTEARAYTPDGDRKKTGALIIH